jgi:tRNA (cmo5U34)-methyltransferase
MTTWTADDLISGLTNLEMNTLTGFTLFGARPPYVSPLQVKLEVDAKQWRTQLRGRSTPDYLRVYNMQHVYDTHELRDFMGALSSVLGEHIGEITVDFVRHDMSPILNLVDSKSSVDNHKPGDKWEFNAEVAGCFDDMLQRSIPGYLDMREMVTELTMLLIDTTASKKVVDLGASLGRAAYSLAERKFFDSSEANMVLVEPSEDMINRGKQLLSEANLSYTDQVEWCCTTAEDYSSRRIRRGITYLTLTMMFVPPEHRPSMLRQIYMDTEQNGSLIVVEKTVGSNGSTDRVLKHLYKKFKVNNGYTVEQIEEKWKSLERVLMPSSAEEIERMLHASGFTHVQQFFRSRQFVGWFAIRE